MSRPNLLAAIFVALLIVVGGGAYFYRLQSQQDLASPKQDSSVPLQVAALSAQQATPTPAPATYEVNPNTPEIEFKNEIEFGFAILVDGRPFHFDCPSGATDYSQPEPKQVAVVQLDEKTKGLILCHAPDADTTELALHFGKGFVFQAELSKESGSEGNVIDHRSWLRKNAKTGRIFLDSLEYSSFTELCVYSGGGPDCKDKVESCHGSSDRGVWDPAQQSFVDDPQPFVVPVSVLRKLNVNKNCIDKNGHWIEM